jgi:hypothetical protein
VTVGDSFGLIPLVTADGAGARSADALPEGVDDTRTLASDRHVRSGD